MNPGTPNGDEQASAELAEHRLAAAGLPRVEVHEVARLVLITAHHSPASADLAGTRVSDADLAILAGEPARYRSSVAALRAESPHLADRLWLTSRQAVLTALLGRPHLFHTGFGRLHWEQAARDNLSTELAELVS